jgi:hypothetical protein
MSLVIKLGFPLILYNSKLVCVIRYVDNYISNSNKKSSGTHQANENGTNPTD